MADHSQIEWTDATWNPITGCSVVSPGCTNCYAMGLAGGRMRNHPSRAGLTRETKAGPVWTGEVRFNEQWLTQPLHWRKPRMIFVCAHGDLFHESVPDAWIDRVFAVMALAPQHTFQVLTKRSARMLAYLGDADRCLAWEVAADPTREDAFLSAAEYHALAHRQISVPTSRGYENVSAFRHRALPNVWLGVSAEDQRRADERVPDLLATPAAVRFVSAEPLLGPIDFSEIDGALGKLDIRLPKRAPDIHPPITGESTLADAVAALGGTIERRPGLDWVIVGGESGDGARPMHPDWARSIRDQCAATGVPFFFKQWGEWKESGHDEDGPFVRELEIGTEEAESFKAIAGHPGFLSSDGRFYRHEDDIPDGASARLMDRMGKARAGRLLDGVEHNALPVRP